MLRAGTRPSPVYRREGNAFLIELKLTTLAQLFNSLDPSPLREKELHDEVETYIVESALEFPHKTPLKLVFHVRETDRDEAEHMVALAVHHHFEYKAAAADWELRNTLRQGRISLVIGFLFLFACILARRLLQSLGSGAWAEILEEGLLISGWVAMWRPLQIFLYEWWPVAHMRRTYSKLAQVPMEIRTAG